MLVKSAIKQNLPEMSDTESDRKSSSDVSCRNLFVRNLDFTVSEKLLKEKFDLFGAIESVEVIKDSDGRSKGYGFVCFESAEDAVEAMTQMHRKFILSKPIIVAMARRQDDRIPLKSEYLPNDRVLWQSQQDIKSEASYASTSSGCREELYTQRMWNNGIAQRVRTLYQEKLYTDVKFTINMGRNIKASLLAHKAILAVGSPKFAEMLFDDATKETGSRNNPMEISISNISFEAFRNIIEYLYTDDVFFDNDVLALETLRGAKQFQIQFLVDRCESYFESLELSEHNACSMFQLAISNNMENLKNRCSQFIQENTDTVIKSENFRQSPINTVRSICKLQKLNLPSEVELFEAIMMWCLVQDKGTANKRAIIDPLLKCIRFLTMDAGEFSALMKKYPDILATKEILDIMMYLANPPHPQDFSNLPQWCNKGEKRCFYKNQSLSQLSLAGKQLIEENRVMIPLKPSKGFHDVTSLKCILEMKCVRGKHKIKAVNLSFQGPVEKDSFIKSLILNVHVSPSGFKLQERLQIKSSFDVHVTLSRPTLARTGDVVHIVAEATGIEHYNFPQFDESSSFSQNCPFACTVSSYPKDNRLFFISEVEICPQLNPTFGVYRKRR